MKLKSLKFAFASLLVSVSLLLVGGLLPASAAPTFQSNACEGLSQLDSAQDCQHGGNSALNIVSTIVSILSLIVGVAAVIMIIIAGLKYITAAGDSNGLSSAKNTLIYALVGLVVASLAQFLVHFVFNRVTQPVCRSDSALSANDPKCK